jgi:translation elongation factor P/translation initiation factor 5A
MDLDSFETLDISISEELKEEVKEGSQVEYWVVQEVRIIKRVTG